MLKASKSFVHQVQIDNCTHLDSHKFESNKKRRNNEDLSRIQTCIAGEEGENADHQTTPPPWALFSSLYGQLLFRSAMPSFVRTCARSSPGPSRAASSSSRPSSRQTLTKTGSSTNRDQCYKTFIFDKTSKTKKIKSKF